MKKIIQIIVPAFFILLPHFLQAQILDRVWAYEGFDYYQGTINANLEPDVFTLTGYKDIPTIASQQISASISIPIHTINEDQSNTNAALGLGWAGDWVHSTGTTNETNYRVTGGTFTSPISSASDDISLVNSGVFGRGGGGTSIGRRLQTSTGGPFFQFELDGGPFAQGTNPVIFSSSDRVDPFLFLDPVLMEYPSPIRLRGAGNEGIVRHNAAQTFGSPTPITHTNNTWIGAQGSSIWVAVMMRKNATNDEECYISLHRNDTEPWNIDQANTVQIGYFGAASNNAGNRYWGVRVNGTVTAATGSDDARITPGTGDEFDLLITEINFDYTGNHTISLYVLRDGSRGGGYASPGTRFENFINGTLDPSLLTSKDLEVTALGTTNLSFHSLSYFGGTSADQSAIDEIRFGGALENVALTSDAISLVRGLCEESGGTSGENIYPVGSFGEATSINPDGSSATPAADEIQGSNADCVSGGNAPDPTDGTRGDNVSPDNPLLPVIIKRADAEIEPGIEYQDITGGAYIYVANQGGQPNDGAFTVATQYREVFGAWNSFYDNSPNRNGLMMIVNAAYQRGEFFRRTIDGLCGDTQYEFFVDIMNITNIQERTITSDPLNVTPNGTNNRCNPTEEPGCSQFSFGGTDQSQSSGIGAATASTGTRFYINPDIEFLIDGDPVYIPPITVANDALWHRVGFTFVTKSDFNVSGTATLSFRNRAPGGIGNDLAIDNITFRPCGPSSVLNNLGECADIELLISPGGEGYTAPRVLWQSSSDGGLTWTDLPDLPGNPNPVDATPGANPGVDPSFATIPQNDPALGIAHGDLVRALIAGSDLFFPNEQCRIVVDPTTVNCFSALPVDLLNFEAQTQIEGIALTWETQQEINVEEFEVERSIDNVNFTKVASYKAANTGELYRHIDRFPAAGVNYYRLKQVEQDGSSEYSSVVSAEWSQEGNISVYPNPSVNGLAYISFDTPEIEGTEVAITFVNSIGKVEGVIESKVSATKQVVIDTRHITNGLYVLEINVKGTVLKKKLVVQNN